LLLTKWFAKRGAAFVGQRAKSLVQRYGISPEKAASRIVACVATLAEYGCAPTLATPGSIVRRHSAFIREVQAAGAEIAVHSYDHVDLAACRTEQAVSQLLRGWETFQHYGIEAHGFRCPYLSYTNSVFDALPKGLFDYSSNVSVRWDLSRDSASSVAGGFFDTVNQFYHPQSAAETVCVPYTDSNVLEIPVCVPDDIQMHDGLGVESEGIGTAWIAALSHIYDRGELFTLLFHPELADCCEPAFRSLLPKARRLKPEVWIARLQDVSDWWKEKSNFTIETRQDSSRLRVVFNCSERATILARGLHANGTSRPWDERYCRLQGHRFDLPAEPRPFVGVENATTATLSFLKEQGYIVETDEGAGRCAIHIDRPTLARLANPVELINYIELRPGPLMRLWRWPDGFKCALSITGDLDALSLLDYASRLAVR
jgi:peptidoglycan/xylan/chitin deacetylase (PgdA/CDA1 family)